MSNQLIIHFQIHYSENKTGSELCCNVFPTLLFDEIPKTNSPVALAFGELPNLFLSDQGVAAWAAGQ